MIDTLSQKLTATLERIKGKARISEENIAQTLREMRLALLEADVALPVAKAFINQVREQAIGQVVHERLNPGQTFVRICREQLADVLGGKEAQEISFDRARPVVILLAGLQGAGKTTTAVKLANWCKKKKQRVLLCTTDVYRPAAMEQLQILCQQDEHEYLITTEKQPVTIAQNAITEAKKRVADVVIVDTAGRLSVNQEMMDEISNIHNAVTPAETLLVVDAMTGQDAANMAKLFHERLALSGVILTKADSDARGGAALSVAHVSGTHIRFLGTGEKTTALEVFDAQRMAKQILGMGDVLGIIEQAEEHVDKKQALKLEKKLRSGKNFDLNDYMSQLQQLEKMGGLTSIAAKIPGLGNLNQDAISAMGNRQINKHTFIIQSMTSKERRTPEIINSSRKRRISKGAGCELVDINRLLKQHKQMTKLMKKTRTKGGMRKMMQQLQGNNIQF